jgi:phage tail-like protein
VSPEGLSEPFTAFSFRVELWLPGASSPLCDAAFARCDGLEMRFDVRAIREGGADGGQRLFTEPAAPGRVTLQRGMTASFDLWQWCTAVARDRGPRADCVVVVLAPDGATERARFRLRGCLPVRLRGPALDAVAGGVAIEELELACESLFLEPLDAGPPPAAADRAELRELDQSFEREINPKRWVRAQVNPESIDLAFVNADPSAGGAGTASLTLELWLDVTAGTGRPGRQPPDLRRLTDAFAYFITPRPTRGGRGLAPPVVRLAWGAFTFDGHMDALRQSFGLFSPDGRPGRAQLAISISRPWIVRRPPGG